MAHKGIANTSASVLRDEIKAKFNGNLAHVPDSGRGEYWVYKTSVVASAPAVLFTDDDEFLGNERTGDSVATGDIIRWIAIKNLGYKQITKVSKTIEGIMLNYTGTNPLYNGTNDAATNNIVIGPGELFVAKLNGVLVEDLKVGTCVLNNFVPSQLGTDNVAYIVAAIIDDISA
jgi:hypothetical protein